MSVSIFPPQLAFLYRKQMRNFTGTFHDSEAIECDFKGNIRSKLIDKDVHGVKQLKLKSLWHLMFSYNAGAKKKQFCTFDGVKSSLFLKHSQLYW